MKLRKIGVIIAAFLLALTVAGTGCSFSPQAKRDRALARAKELSEKRDYARAVLECRNAIKAMPNDPEAHYQLGLAYMNGGNVRSALGTFRQVLKLDPRHSGAQLRLAQILQASGREDLIEDARKRLQELLKGNPGNPEALQTLAITEFKLGQATEAMNRLQDVVAKYPQHLASSVALAEVKLAQKDVAGAEQVLKNACAQAPTNPGAYLMLGWFYRALKRLDGAEAQFRKAVELEPGNGAAVLNLALTLEMAGRTAEAEQRIKQLSRFPDKEYHPLYAVYLAEHGRIAQAVQELEARYKEDSSNRRIRSYLIAGYRATKRTADAERLLQKALEKSSKDTDALIQHSQLALDARDYATAQSDLNKVLNLNPNSAEVHYRMAQVHRASGNRLSERQALTEAVRVNPQLLPARLLLAQRLLEANAGATALNVMNETPRHQAGRLPAILQRNWALLAINNHGELRSEIDRAMGIAKVPELYLQDGALKLALRDYSGARSSLLEAMKGMPEDQRVLNLMARTYEVQNQVPAATQLFRQHASAHPSSAPVQQFWGNWLQARGQVEEARAVLLAARGLKGVDTTGVDMRLAQIDMQQNRADLARERLTPVLAAKTAPPTVRVMMAEIERTQGNHKQAIDLYRQILETTPEHVVALNNLAYLLTEYTNEADEALRYAQKAKELAPDNPAIDDTLGWVLYRKGIYSSAIRQFEAATTRASNLSPDSAARFRYHLAMAYFRSGDRKRGDATLEAALRLNAALPEAKLAQQVRQEAVPSLSR